MGYQHVCSGPGDECMYVNTHALSESEMAARAIARAEQAIAQEAAENIPAWTLDWIERTEQRLAVENYCHEGATWSANPADND